jgi:hypothetical protein
MYTQSAKTPTPRESVTITLTPNERYLLLGIIEAVTDRVFTASSPSDVDWLEPFFPVSGNFLHLRDLNFKLQDTLFKSGDACRHSAQSSDAVGQGGAITCHLCEGRGSYIKLNSSKLSECEWCRGSGIGLRSVEGGNL